MFNYSIIQLFNNLLFNYLFTYYSIIYYLIFQLFNNLLFIIYYFIIYYSIIYYFIIYYLSVDVEMIRHGFSPPGERTDTVSLDNINTEIITRNNGRGVIIEEWEKLEAIASNTLS